MQVEKFTMEQFTAMGQPVIFNFSPGINVLIGANSTGKSHVMKALYTLLKASEEAQLKQDTPERLQMRMQEKLQGVFKPDTLGRLVRRAPGRGSARLKVIYNGQALALELTTLGNVRLAYKTLIDPEPTIYLPAREFLTLYEGFIALYEKRELAFDETYYDLSLALNAAPLRGPRVEKVKALVEPLIEAIHGNVQRKNDRFYLDLPEGSLESQLVAEGYRKIGTLMQLLINGSLSQSGILFWDEPASNLNPNLVTVIVKVLRAMAQAGMQIFVATHDYLLSQELSLATEYHPEAAIKFFALHQPAPGQGTEIEAGNTLVDIENDSILAEFAAHYDREQELFLSSHDSESAGGER